MSGLLSGPNGLVFGAGGVMLRPIEQAPAAENYATFRNDSGGTITNFPLQQARAFVKGEIANYPQILVDGTPVTTQAQVEQRWDDGTVKHAVLFCHLPAIADGATVTLTYQNQASGNTTGGLTAATVLADWDFDATLEMTSGGVTKTTSARTMLAAGHYTTLYSGSVATCFIIADHSSSETYDYGFGSYTEMRPIFHATFWPSTGQTKIRFINELAKTTELGSVSFDSCTGTIGDASPSTVFTLGAFTQNLASRWTRPLESGGYWKGGSPTEDYTLDHNISYLSKTTLFPCWDLDTAMVESSIAGKYTTYTASNKDLYVTGTTRPAGWFKIWDDGAGRDDLGLYAGQTIWQLLTGGDTRMRKLALGMADVFGAFPYHFREAEYGRSRSFDRRGSTDAGGKVLSINCRPTTCWWGGRDGLGTTATADKVTIVDGSSGTSWARQNYAPDNSHAPDPFTINYMLTGDFWYLEELWFLASYLCAYPSPTTMRGPSGYYGGNLVLGGEPRDIAWPNRARFHAWSATPERFSDEKDYFYTMSLDTITAFEGCQGMTSTQSADPDYSALYTWANTTKRTQNWPYGNPVTYHYDNGVNYPSNTNVDWTKAKRMSAPWMHNYELIVFAEAVDLGLPATQARDYGAMCLITRVTDGGISPFTFASYYEPTQKVDGTNFTNWADLADAYADAYYADNETTWNTQINSYDAGHNYAFIAYGAAAWCYDVHANGPTLWTWMQTNGAHATALARWELNPIWKFEPRSLAYP